MKQRCIGQPLDEQNAPENTEVSHYNIPGADSQRTPRGQTRQIEGTIETDLRVGTRSLLFILVLLLLLAAAAATASRAGLLLEVDD